MHYLMHRNNARVMELLGLALQLSLLGSTLQILRHSTRRGVLFVHMI